MTWYSLKWSFPFEKSFVNAHRQCCWPALHLAKQPPCFGKFVWKPFILLFSSLEILWIFQSSSNPVWWTWDGGERKHENFVFCSRYWVGIKQFMAGQIIMYWELAWKINIWGLWLLCIFVCFYMSLAITIRNGGWINGVGKMGEINSRHNQQCWWGRFCSATKYSGI